MRRVITICLALVAFVAAAQTDSVAVVRPVTSAFMLQIGASRLADTYLTPLRYTGTHYAFAYERTQALRFAPQRWVSRIAFDIGGDVTKNPAKNATMASIELNAGWQVMHRWALPWTSDLEVACGPGLSLMAGCLYLARNGNNPASAKASLTADAAGYVSWSHRLGRVPMQLRYQAVLPVTGLFFAPNYAQLYYQIYLGDHQGLCHGAWWGNYFMLDNLVTADFSFGATTVRIGYRGRFHSTKINHLVTQEASHAIVLGLVTDWISLRR